jgi:hypothetical protein
VQDCREHRAISKDVRGDRHHRKVVGENEGEVAGGVTSVKGRRCSTAPPSVEAVTQGVREGKGARCAGGQ